MMMLAEGWQHLLLPICPVYLQAWPLRAIHVPSVRVVAIRIACSCLATASPQEAIIDAPVPFISALPEITPQVGSRPKHP